MRKRDNLLLIFTGDGKGKTTAALGAAIRAAGHGCKVLFVQFLKGRIRSGEQILLKKHSEELNIQIVPLGGGFVVPNDKESFKKAKSSIQRGLKKILVLIHRLRPQMVILDELSVALSLSLMSREEAETLIFTSLSYGHTIVTGRGAPDWLIERADTVTEMCEVAHPYRKGIHARKGVEF
ncbi:MAG: cob(I)yrinic acid a,c-diamide adenosyltransferase [Planctomycetota bacterium]|nr:cob(I)yrinic acid a,c-diamide adenosyltransferase [Planctomycetota bacterium]